MADLDKFLKQVSRARINMSKYEDAEFFSMVALKLKIEPNEEIESLRTNGSVIQINPDFFDSLTPDQRIGVMFHEVLHVALGHTIRKSMRDPRIWNIAADYAVNRLIERWGMNLPEQKHSNSDYDHLTTEDIYELIYEDQLNNPDEQPQYNDIGIMSNNASDGSQDDDSNEGNGDSQSNGNNPLEGHSESFTEQDLHELLSEARTAMEMMGKNAGKMPAELERLFEKMEKPVLNWKLILQRFLHANAKNRYSWKRPNRRYESYMPSRYGEGLSRVDFLIDVSGSISKKEFNVFLSEVDSVLKQFMPNEIGVSQFDDHFRGTDVVRKYQDITDVTFNGGGGTCIRSSLEVMKDYPSKAIIIFTDGYICDLEGMKPISLPVVWCVYDNKDFKEPFGKVIHFSKKDLMERNQNA